MKTLISSTKQHASKFRNTLGIALISLAGSAQAALPQTSNPSQQVSQGDYLGLIKGYGYDIGIIVGLFIATIAFIVVAKNVIGVYSEIGQGKKTWGDMGMHGAMGVLLLVFVVYLVTEAAKIIF